MKKIYAIMLSAVILSLSALTAVAVTVDSQKDKVTVTENVLYGEKSEAEGLTVINRNHYNNRLFWETEYVLGEKPITNTDYSFSLTQKYEKRRYTHNGISLYDDIEYGFNESKPISEQKGISKAYKKLYDSTEKGERSSKTIYLKDYYEYYPIGLNFDLPNTVWAYSSDEEVGDKPFDPKYVGDKFREYFKIPVLESDCVEIEVTKRDNGQLYSSGTSTISSYNMYSVSTYTDNQCFFTIRHISHGKDGNEFIDTSLIPGGYGIYAFNYGRTEGEFHTGIDADSLKTVYPLSKEISVDQMGISPDQKMLYFISNETNGAYFTVLDIATMTELQKIHIDNGTFSTVYDYDEFLVAFSEKNITVLTLTDGIYKKEFTVPSANRVNPEFQYIWGKDSMDFDGEKLAISGCLIDDEYGYETCDFYVSVYDSSGLVFYGEYKNNLSANYNYSQYGLNCHPYDYSPDTVKWNK